MRNIIIFLALAAVIGCGGGATVATSASKLATTQAPAKYDTATPLPAPATFTPLPKPTNTPTVEPSPTPLPAPETHSGNGDSIVALNWPSDTPAIVKITHSGSRNFAVWSINGENSKNDLLVNAIGKYNGTVPLNFSTGENTTRLQITADGAWNISVQPLVSARQFKDNSPASGSGDDVIIFLTDKKFDTATITGNSAGRSFAIWAYTDTTTDLLVNTTDPYEGEVLLPSASVIVFVVSAETGDKWTITPSIR